MLFRKLLAVCALVCVSGANFAQAPKMSPAPAPPAKTGKMKKMPARDPKTGRFIKKTPTTTGAMATDKMSPTDSSSKMTKKMPARDPKTGRFIKKAPK